MSKVYPEYKAVYPFILLESLDLPDRPALNITVKGKLHPIQDAHVSDDQIMKRCPEFENSLWQYIGTTDEDIPIFNYAGPEELIEKLVDTEPYQSRFGRGQGGVWVTPKNSPRKQLV